MEEGTTNNTNRNEVPKKDSRKANCSFKLSFNQNLISNLAVAKPQNAEQQEETLFSAAQLAQINQLVEGKMQSLTKGREDVNSLREESKSIRAEITSLIEDTKSLREESKSIAEDTKSLREELADVKTILGFSANRHRRAVIREMCHYLRSQIVTSLDTNSSIMAIAPKLLSDLQRNGWWQQNVNESYAHSFTLDELWDAVYTYSRQEADLITAFDLTAKLMGGSDFASRPKYKTVEPLP